MGPLPSVRIGWMVGLWIAVAMPAGVLAEDKLELSIDLKEGQEFRYRRVTDQQFQQTMNDQQIDSAQKMGVGLTITVLSVDDAGHADVKVMFHWIMDAEQAPMGSYAYDSDTHDPDQPIPPMAMGMAAMLGQGFHAMFIPDGSIEVYDIAPLLERMINSIDVADELMKDMLSDRTKAKFGEAQIVDMMSNLFAAYPDRPVAVGESWTRVDEQNMGLATTIDGTYTLVKREGGVATIDVTSTTATPTDAPPLEMGTARLTPVLAGDQKGTTQYHEATGMVLDMRMTQNQSGTLIVEAEQLPAPMVLPTKIQSRVRITQDQKTLGEPEADAQDD